MGIKILLADPSEKWLGEISKYLRKINYEVFVADTGKSAQQILYSEDIFCIVLSLDITNHSGGQVFTFLRSNFAHTKVVLKMDKDQTLAANNLEKKHLFKMGITNVFSGKVGFEDIKNALAGFEDYDITLQRVKNIKRESENVDEKEFEVSEERLAKIDINDFFLGKLVLFDIYIKLSDKKFIKILHAGDQFSSERLNTYSKEKNVKHLYFFKEERTKFIHLSNHIIKKLNKSPGVSTGIKLNIFKNALIKFAESNFDDGIKFESVELAKEFTDNIYDFINVNNDLAKYLKEIDDFGVDLINHTYLVTIFSVMLASQFDWCSRVVLQTLGMACLFHDIGFTKLPNNLRTVNHKNFSDDELKLYKTHVSKGVEILDNIACVPTAVKQIVSQHHERIDGSGFPNKIRTHKVLLLSQVLALADDFSHIIENKKVKPIEALKLFLTQKELVKQHNSTLVSHLLNVFKGQHI